MLKEPPLLLENARWLLGDRVGTRPFHCNPGRFYVRLSGKNPSTKENEKRMEIGNISWLVVGLIAGILGPVSCRGETRAACC
jgi:hypothetical protein